MEQKYKALIYSTYKDVYFERKMEFTQHDSKTAKILFECYDDINVPMTDIQYAVLNIRRPDGKTYTFGMSYDGNPVFEINNNNVLLILPPAALYIAGKKYEGSVALHGTGGKRLTVARFTYDVIEDMTSDTPIDETNEFPILAELIDDVTILKDAYKGALENNVNGEVIAARRGEKLLGDRLDKFDSQLAQTARVINIKQQPYNADSNGVNDVTTIIEQAINDALNTGIKVIHLPQGFYRTTKKIIIPNGIVLKGEEGITSVKWSPSDNTDATHSKDGGRPSNELSGTWIFYDGSQNDSVFEVLEGGTVENLGFWYVGNSWDKWSLMSEVYPYGVGYMLHKPKEYAPAIISSADEVRLKNLFFINAYECIRINTGQNIFLENIKINPIHMGINVIRSGAHLVFNKIDIYPYWSRAYGYLGDSMRPNLYNEVYGTGIKIGDPINGTLEQTLLTDIDVFGCADGLLIGGKGVQGSNIKVDNSFRPMTITGNNSSSFHNLSNLWLSCFVSQNYSKPQAIKDGSVYALKIGCGGTVNIDNLQIPRTDGIGVHIVSSSYNVNVSNVYIGSCLYKGLVAETDNNWLWRLSINNISVYCSNTDVIPYEFKRLNQSTVKNITWSGANPTTKLIQSSNVECNFDFSTLIGNQKREIKGVEQQTTAIIRLDVSSNGTISAVSLTKGVSAIVLDTSEMDGLKFLELSPRPPIATIGLENGYGGQMLRAIPFSDIADPRAIRFYDRTTNSIVPSSHESVAGKSFLIQCILAI